MQPPYRVVLAVDDDPILLQVLTAFFAKHGTGKVLTASNGAEAIKTFDANPAIDVILSDLHMPGASGIEFMNHLQDVACQIPLIIISSATKTTFDGATTLAKAYRLNLIGALSKPVRLDDLSAALNLHQPA